MLPTGDFGPIFVIPGAPSRHKVHHPHPTCTQFLGAVAYWPFAKTQHRAAFRLLLAIMRKVDGAWSPSGWSATAQKLDSGPTISLLAPSGQQISIWGPFGSPRDRFPTISERLFAYFAPSNGATSQPHNGKQQHNLATSRARRNARSV